MKTTAIKKERSLAMIIALIDGQSETKRTTVKDLALIVGVSRQTVHRYMNHLMKSGIIHRNKQGEYKIIARRLLRYDDIQAINQWIDLGRNLLKDVRLQARDVYLQLSFLGDE